MALCAFIGSLTSLLGELRSAEDSSQSAECSHGVNGEAIERHPFCPGNYLDNVWSVDRPRNGLRQHSSALTEAFRAHRNGGHEPIGSVGFLACVWTVRSGERGVCVCVGTCVCLCACVCV